MKSIAILLFVISVVVGFSVDSSFAWKPNPGGTRISGMVVYESGDTLKFSDMIYVDDLNSEKENNPVLTIQYKTTMRKIPIEKISYILIVSRTCEQAGLYKSEIEMGTKAGDKINAIVMDGLRSIVVTYIDEITKEKQETHINPCSKTGYVKMIYFDEVGNLAFNPRSKEYYPASYNFDPYTGEKLVKRMPE